MIKIIVAVALSLTTIILSYYIYQSYQASQQLAQQIVVGDSTSESGVPYLKTLSPATNENEACANKEVPSHWITFENKAYNYTIKHPFGTNLYGSIQQDEKFVVLTIPLGETDSFYVRVNAELGSNPKKLRASDWTMENEWNQRHQPGPDTMEEILVNNRPTYFMEFVTARESFGGDDKSIPTFLTILNGTDVYEISYSRLYGENPDLLQNFSDYRTKIFWLIVCSFNVVT